MKFLIVFSMAINMVGHGPHKTYAFDEVFFSRAACMDGAQGVAAVTPRESHGHIHIDGFACIQVEGPVKKFPVRERVAEGWERA